MDIVRALLQADHGGAAVQHLILYEWVAVDAAAFGRVVVEQGGLPARRLDDGGPEIGHFRSVEGRGELDLQIAQLGHGQYGLGPLAVVGRQQVMEIFFGVRSGCLTTHCTDILQLCFTAQDISFSLISKIWQFLGPVVAILGQ